MTKMNQHKIKRTSTKSSKRSQPSRSIQQDLFTAQGKRGRPRTKPTDHFGGVYLKNYNPKSKRPMDSKKALHLVLRSTHAKNDRSFKHQNHESRIWEIISNQARRTGIKIYAYANSGNHLHLLLRAKLREDFTSFIRAVTGLIARQVGQCERGAPLKKKFWDARPFSRVVSFTKKEFAGVKTYIYRNTLETIGWAPYISRKQAWPKRLRSIYTPIQV